MLKDLPSSPFNEDLSTVYKVRPVGYSQGVSHVMVGEKYSYALALKVQYGILQLRNRFGIYPGKGFVQQKKTRIEGETPAYLEPPFFSPGKASCKVALKVQKPYLLQGPFDYLVYLPGVTVVFLENYADIVFNRKLVEKGNFLGR